MKPEIGKWYMIEYADKREPDRSYFGPAECVLYSEQDKGWGFRFPDEPESWRNKTSVFGLHLFKKCDIKHECLPEPSYRELKEQVEYWRSRYENECFNNCVDYG